MIHEISDTELSIIRSLLATLLTNDGVVSNMARSGLKFSLGKAWIDDLSNPTNVLYFPIYKHYILAGESNSPVVPELLQQIPPRTLICPTSQDWIPFLEEMWGDKLRASIRTSFSEKKLDREYIKELKKPLPEGFKLKKVDKEIAQQLDALNLAFIGPIFGSIENFMANGLGFCILDGEKPVSAITSFLPFSDRLEIEIITLDFYRRKGFATLLSAVLIEYCFEHNIAPCWDAANQVSTKLALKLGYSDPQEYEVYYWV
ncbi:MAG: GNAT family N-acetyltransferase [Candidatus Hodarchaeota archaeon]